MVTESWIARVNAVVDAVRDDPGSSHTLEALASTAHSAPHHFHRQFRAVVGETPAQFVRRSRLERAGYLMMAGPNMTLTDIAFATGFSDASDLSRSFKRHYGVAPSDWSRRQGGTRSAPSEQPTVAVISRPAMRLATIRIRGIFGLDDMSQGYRQLCEWMADRGLDLDRSQLVGASFDNYRITPRDRIHYTFGFTVPPHIEPTGSIVIRDLPAFTGAAVSIDGALPDIADAWDHLYDHWFPSRPWVPSALPAMKLFHRRPDEIGWDHFELDCVVAFRHAALAEAVGRRRH